MAGSHPIQLAGLIGVVALTLATRAAEPAVGDPSSAPERPHALSPHLASALADKLPKFDPAAGQATAAKVEKTDEDRPSNTIIRLPDYIVRAARPPEERDLLTKKGREAEAAQRYLGEADGLDRSLNAVTLTDLWKKIPVMGKIPFVPFNSLNNGERALKVNERAEEKRPFKELLDFDASAKKIEKDEAKPAEPPKS